MIVLTIPKGLIKKAIMGSIGPRNCPHDIRNRIGWYLCLSRGIVRAICFQASNKWCISGIIEFGASTIEKDDKSVLCRSGGATGMSIKPISSNRQSHYSTYK